MESARPRAQAVTARLRSRLTDPLVHVAVTVALFAWLLAPGVIEPDTKTDLVVSPGRYLARGVQAWSTHSGFGELQNQAYGYLFPMGAFFDAGHVIGLPSWAIQRCWWSLLLGVGCLGASLVARRVIGLGSTGAAVAGLGYALSPRLFTLLSELSVEAWPGMVMPWILLAVHRRRHGHTTRARFAVEVGALAVCLGGVNATASLVPLLAGGIYLLARRGRRGDALAYLVGALCGAAWWLGPLVVLGRYAYPFLDYIETARITTAVTSVPGILRGASDWVAYIVDATGHPVWQSGWVVAQGTASIVGGLLFVAVALFGLRGLAGVREPSEHRRGFIVLFVVGVLGMGAPYVGAVSGPFAPWLRDLLDGPAAAARNVHKLDPLVRLPLALGAGWVVHRAIDAAGAHGQTHRGRGGAWLQAGLAGALAVGFIGSLLPFWQGRVTDPGGVRAFPTALERTAAAVDADARDDGGTTLVLPSSRTAAFSWGTTTDEPLSAFASSPIAVRASAPLVHPGAVRLMDAVDAAVAEGRDLPAVAAALQRAGVKRIVIRHGLTDATQTRPAQQYVDALVSDPESFPRHRTFRSGSTGASARYDLFDVRGGSPQTQGRSIPVLGGPESTITLSAVGVRPGVPYLMGAAGGWITDDVRKRVYNNGRPAALAFGPTLTASSQSDAPVGRRDLDFAGRAESLTTLALDGADTLTASGSASDPFSTVWLGDAAGPAAALDDDPTSAWLTPLRRGTTSNGTLRFGWTHGSHDLTLKISLTARGGSVVAGVRVDADGRPLMVHDGTVKVPAGTRDLTLTPWGRRVAADGAIGIASVDTVGNATPRFGAIVHLPGTLVPATGGAVLSRSAEDGTTWTRRLTVAKSGTMTVNLTSNQRTCPSGALAIRTGTTSWHSIPGGCRRRVTLGAGQVDLKVGPGVDRVSLEPTAEVARERLGLTGTARPAGPSITATTTGANLGWTAPGRDPVTVDGWRQGFTGGPQDLRPRFTPQRSNTLALASGGLLAGVLLGAVLLPWGRRERTPIVAEPASRPARRGTSRTAWTVTAGIAVGVILGGWWGLLASGVALGIPARWRLPIAVGAVAATGPVMAVFGVVDRASAGAFTGQLLGIFGLVAFLTADVGPLRWRAVRRGSS